MPSASASADSPSPSATPGEVIDLDIAILGGGFAGVYCARRLGKRLRGREVGILADENHMTFQPMLPEVAGGSLAPRHVVNPIRLLARNARVLKCEISAIDVEKKTITASAGAFTPELTVRCQHLVLALGAVVNLSRIPGMPEHAYLLRNVGDAMKLRAAIVGRVEEANLVTDPIRRQRLLDFVVVGGGYSGTETAGQVIDLLNSIHRFYRNIGPGDYSVSLIHSRDVLLPTMAPSLGEYTRDCLEKQGVRVFLEHRVKAVTAKQVILDDGTALPSSLVVSTVGNAPHPVITDIVEQHDLQTERGKIATDRFLRVPGLENVWAAGDCAAVPFANDQGEEKWCPPNAQFALRQGETVGNNIAACYPGNRRGLSDFRFSGLGELAAIGHHKAVANVFGLNFSGFLAWWMWRSIYLAKLPGLDRKLRVMVEWTLDVFFPRDISLLTPSYTSGVKETHLEAGDLLFQTGEPAFSFYMVKDGSIDITDDDQRLVRTIETGGHFGERALLEDRRWRYNAIAREPSTLVSLGEHLFRQLVAGCGDVAEVLTKTAATYASQEQIDQVMARIPKSAQGRRVAELMSTEICSLKDSQTVDEALDLLKSQPHSTYPVLTDQGEVLGVLRRGQLYDLLKGDALSMSTRLRDVPLSQPPRVRLDDSVSAALEALIRSSKTKSLVLDENQRLAGILSLMDLLEADVSAGG